MGDKGINIDDTTAVLVPSAHNPAQPTDTFPSWPNVASQIGSIRTFHYADSTPANSWVTWAVQNNINVMVGLTLAGDSAEAEIQAFSDDYKAADHTLKTLYDTYVIANRNWQ